MVGLEDEESIKVYLLDSTNVPMRDSPNEFYIIVTPSKQIESIFMQVAERFTLSPEDIEITFKVDGKDYAALSPHKQKSLVEAELWLWTVRGNLEFEFAVTLSKNKNMALCYGSSDISEDELHLGASASPTTGELTVETSDEYSNSTLPFCDLPGFDYNQGRRKATQLSPVVAESPSYVGLVNQAMTCYLNSLLQALYMTPEFRNALYNWEFDGANESRSIPYQLQKLFLNLQTSTKSAVETTNLTTSFGWQGSDAWHQHDIQELCRVMFDALEQKFKDTKQANLINDLYEGKMLDYVKCLECGTEKSREDTFLDIPLPVRPFGSNVAYNSVEEALRAFVQPETLDGNNQYFCEKCNKKCDAHKGLKFTKFPYLLTLHLKRFDFDYSTMHRIKLNDKVVFPEKLNLNSFIPPSRNKAEYNNLGEGESLTKCDDSSTADSGSADDESCQGTDLSSTVNGHDDNCADSDEGIDVSSGTNHVNEQKGPYVYELFSIMIHSGSASGGHYYAYIKDFDKDLWFCFNDQSVSPVTSEDIKKTYGGGPHRTYYTGAYSSSTNAYMLMYRQIDKERNCRAITVKDFPPHIQKLLNNMRQRDEEELMNKKREDGMVKLSVWCYHPSANGPFHTLTTYLEATLREVTQLAHTRFKLEGIMDVNDCRLVIYNKFQECVFCSFESDETMLQDTPRMVNEWMLETREPGTKWRTFKPGGVNMKVYPINLETEEIEEPKIVRVDEGETVGELKEEIGLLLSTDPSSLQVVVGTYSCEPKYFKDDTEIVQFESKSLDYRIYVASGIDKDTEVAKRKLNKLKRLIETYTFVICINIILPETDEATLESLSIPSLDCNQNVDKPEQVCDSESNSPSLRVSPQPGVSVMGGDAYDQSNSEDSSLSDSDRTLIGDAPTEYMGLYHDAVSPTDQHMASPSDPCQDSYNHDVLGHPGEEMFWDNTETQSETQKDVPQNYYFKVASKTIVSPDSDEGTKYSCMVFVDRRMTLEMLKKHFESVLRIPSDYFKVFKCFNLEEEWSRLKDNLRCIKDGEKLIFKLGRVLKEDEFQCRVYDLKPDTTDPNVFMFEHIVARCQTVESVKRSILDNVKKRQNIDIPFNKCRLREKNWKKPKKVYLDDQKFGEEIGTNYNFEMYLQELSEPETVTSNNQVVVFLRKFSPSELTLGSFQEAVLDILTMNHLRSKVSGISGIPLEHLDIAQVKGNYPFDMHLLEINDNLEWNPNVENLEQWPLNVDDGAMFFYKDHRENLKELTTEERREIAQKEDSRLGRVCTRLAGRERALKIYLLDTSPSKLEDDID
ncbi:ubiquitin carboxyl-terminal hydrolase 47 [Euwallacea fornicatus]|uniref:ubiquitin carboxyl-terminal hydrolase 47 n=1 Tax=Euwallacea fornicatus TaxID=995702 RepID=UPI00338F0AC7